MSTALGCADLGRRYGRGLWGLRGSNLDAPAGSVIALVGPNGSGKTIVMSMAAGLLPATTGTVEAVGGAPARRDALAAGIEEAFLSCPSAELLASMPGIGPRTGARILAEVGDGSTFATGSKLAAYAGLAPVTRQSGTSLNAETRSRRGNHRLKNAMFPAAFASLARPRIQDVL